MKTSPTIMKCDACGCEETYFPDTDRSGWYHLADLNRDLKPARGGWDACSTACLIALVKEIASARSPSSPCTADSRTKVPESGKDCSAAQKVFADLSSHFKGDGCVEMLLSDKTGEVQS